MLRGEINTFQRLSEIKIKVGPRKPDIFPRTLGQNCYVDMLQRSSITFGIGPAGTGKTYLAMAKAVSSLINEEVNRIILTRPAIEAGEHLDSYLVILNKKLLHIYVHFMMLFTICFLQN